jgi:3-methyladenine DNA glycosylase AlkD
MGEFMHPYVGSIKTIYEKNADAKAAVPMKRYMRDQFEYLGIKGPKLGELLKGQYARHGFPDISELDGIVRDLWSLPQREYQYTATILIGNLEKQLPEDFIETLEYLIVTKSWWDTVDTISGGTLGIHFKRYPKTKRNIWPNGASRIISG